MKHRFIQPHVFIPVIAVILFAATAVYGQQPANPLVASMAANMKQLKQYRFKQKVEVYRDGELKSARTDEVYYSTSGERVAIPVEERVTESREPKLPPSPIRLMVRKKMESEKEKTREYIDRLVTLATRYLPPDPARLAVAPINKSESDVNIVVHGYVKDNDMMTVRFDPATRRPTKIEIQTNLENDPVSMVLLLDQLRDGTSYPSRMVVSSEAKKLQLRMFTFDYRL